MSFKRTIHAVDTHAGIPMRVITGGVPHIPGDSVHAKMKWLETNDDQLRKLMLREPRGYPGIGITISQLSGPSEDPNADWKNAVTMTCGEFSWDDPATWTGALDRSPCGTGTSAKMATLHAKGELPLHQDFRHQGLLGNIYTGRLIDETSIGGNEAVVPTITGKSWIYGLNTFVLDHDDPFPEGFTIGDIWA
ncbi:proline racemase family protein [Pseudomonas shirazica]|uniref:proline racemase family protein n=1 Tax=Pseudomonas shirazica TaxID=1940636 RepID=UPI0035259795